MEYTLIYDCFLNRFFKNYDFSQDTNEKIEQSISEIQSLLPEEKRNRAVSLKLDIINHLQDLELDHMKQAMEFGVKVGLEMQKIVESYSS